jgi:hypothetical protein
VTAAPETSTGAGEDPWIIDLKTHQIDEEDAA